MCLLPFWGLTLKLRIGFSFGETIAVEDQVRMLNKERFEL